MNPENPQTGHGKSKPKQGSLKNRINVEFRDEEGNLMPNSEKDAYDQSKKKK
jgi:predicted RNA-binding protein with RPS1 domain